MPADLPVERFPLAERVIRGLVGLAVVAALIPTAIGAQQQQPITLAGRVTSTEGLPLGSASVVIEQLNLGTTTRPDGRYTIVVPAARAPTGPVTVTARLLGYRPHSIQVSLTQQLGPQDF